MKICVVGAGGREHALAQTLAKTATVVVTPGSAGIPGSLAHQPPAAPSAIAPEEISADLFVIGPEGPLANGLADRLRAQGKAVFGPGQDGAQLESSKAWMKQLVHQAGVPTAGYQAFGAAEQLAACEFLASLRPPYVVKTDGLAAGKGVLVTDSLEQAQQDVAHKLSGEAFGEAGQALVIEEGLTGPEVSIFAICDGRKAVVIPTAAQDHKRLGDGDTGPNTGGMGCFSPVPGIGPTEVAELARLTIDPTMAELVRRGIDYRGVLYAGLMLTPDGPRLLEFNVRFGDPEAQVILPRLENNLAELLLQAANGNLVDAPLVSDDAMVCVVCAAAGYPSDVRTGDKIAGLAQAAAVPGATVFAAGVGPAPAASDPAETAPAAVDLYTAGGRVLGVCGRSHTVAAARQSAYAAVDKLSWPGMQYRTDIGGVGPAPGASVADSGAAGA